MNIIEDFNRFIEIEMDGDRSIKSILWIFLRYPGIYAVLNFRFGQFVSGLGARFYLYPLYIFLLVIYSLTSILVVKMFDIDISRNSQIVKGLYIGHFGGIKITNCTVGDYCSINQQVRIIATDDRKVHIGDYVWIGCHSEIKSGVKIGNHATIPAGSIIDTDIKANSLIKGVPSKVINNNYDNSELLCIDKTND